MSAIEPRQRHPLHSTATILEDAFRNVVASRPKKTSRKSSALRPIIAYGLSDARAAMQAALEQGCQELALLSPAGVGHSLGPQWFNALIHEAEAAVPEVNLIGIMDCGHYEGHVMYALSCGMKHVYYNGDSNTADKLQLLAVETGATLHRQFSEVLDLKHHGDQLTACRAWLSPNHEPLRAQS